MSKIIKIAVVGVHLEVCDSYDDMSAAALNIFKGEFGKSKVLGFATGNTPKGLYRLISQECKEGKMSFKGKTTFNLDEYYPISPDNVESYRHYMQDYVFGNVDIDPNCINFPDSMADEDIAVSKYKEAYLKQGAIDIQILGIGRNGHIAFNEPGSQRDSTIRIVKLSEDTLIANATTYERAITFGIKEILESRTIILMASGKGKADAVSAAMKGDISEKVPASFLREHRGLHVILDKEAASGL